MGRLLWALREALSVAEVRGGALARVALAVRSADSGQIASLAESPFFALWGAVMGNLTRYEVRLPDWIIAAGLHGFAKVLGDVADADVTPVPSPLGRIYRPDGKVGIVVEKAGEYRSIAERGPEGLLMLGDSELLRILVGENPSPIAADVESWREQATAGLRYLAEVSPSQHARVLEHVRMIASFDETPGPLQSLSAGELPGFILARCMNGPAEVGDQFVHETSHQMLDRFLAGQQDLVDELRGSPAAYSPFFQQPRPALKLLHGVVSYLEVLRFWQEVTSSEAYGPHLSRYAAETRLAHVKRLCEIGLRSLRAVATVEAWRRWARHLEALCPAFAPLDEERTATATTVTTKMLVERVGRLAWIQPIERAEVLLAVAGRKISRVSVSLARGADLALALDPLLTPLFSRHVFRTRPERLKGTFSNLAERTFEYYKPPPGATVYAYVARDPEALREAVAADEDDEAGQALGIPACCRAHFAAHWDDARARFEGDLLAWSLEAISGRDDSGVLPWQSNAFAMVAGEGLTWHFPCSFRCPATVQAITRRAKALAHLDAALSNRLVMAQRGAVVWTPDRAFALGRFEFQAGAPTVWINEARSPEWTAGLTRLRSRGPLRTSDGAWVDASGRSIETSAGTGVRVLLFGTP